MYLFGQSPLDAELLRALGQGYGSFADIVAHAPDDAAVLQALQGRPGAIERAARWGSSLHRRRLYMFALDVDDGRLARWRWLKPAANGLSFLLVALVRCIWPARSETAASRLEA